MPPSATFKAGVKRLRQALNREYEKKQPTLTAGGIGTGKAYLGGQIYDGTVEGVATVINVGRPAAASYAPRTGNGTVVKSSGGSSGGSGGGGTDYLRRDGTTPMLGTLDLNSHPIINPGLIGGVDLPGFKSSYDSHILNPNAHHARQHDIISGADHTVAGGAQLDVVGLSAPGTLALLTPSSNPGALSALLKSSPTGNLTLPTFTATTSLTTPSILSTDDLTVTPSGGDVTVNAILSISRPVATSTYKALIQLQDTGTAANSATGIDWRNTTYSWDMGRIATVRNGSTNSFSLAFSTAPSGVLYEALRISYTGNVLIGTTTDSGYKLDVAGSARIATSLTTPLITTASGDLTIDPVGNLLFPVAQTLKTPNFNGNSFPIAGWQVNENPDLVGGSVLTIGEIQADELAVKIFVADETRVDRGNQYWARGFGILAEGFTSPSSIGGTVSIKFEDSPAITGALATNNDWFMFQQIEIGTGLTIANIWGQVTGYVDNGDDTQSWTFTLRAGSTSVLLKKGRIGINWGATGQAVIHLSTIDSSGSPYIKMKSWATNPHDPANHTTHVQIGKLTGGVGNTYYPSPSGYGFYAGVGGNDNRFFAVDSNGLQLHGVNLKMFNGGLQTVDLSATDGSLKLGTNISGPTTTKFYFNGATGDVTITGDLYTDKAYLLRSSGLSIEQDVWGSWDNRRAIQWWPDITNMTGSPSLAMYTGKVVGGFTNNQNFSYIDARPTGGVLAGLSLTAFGQGTGGIATIYLEGGSQSLATTPSITMTASTVDLVGSILLDGTTGARQLNPQSDLGYGLGTALLRWNTIYANQIIAGTISGSMMSGAEWEYAGSMVIDANSASATTVSVVNQGAGVASLSVEGNITLGGTVDSVDIALFKSSYDSHVSAYNAHVANANAHHNQAHVLATTAGLGSDHTVSGLTTGFVLRATGSTSAQFMALTSGDIITALGYTPLHPNGSITGATSQAQILANGVVLGNIYPLVDSTTAVRVRDAGGSNTILNIDSTNLRVGINKVNPATALDITGSITVVDATNAAGGLIVTKTSTAATTTFGANITTTHSGTGNFGGMNIGANTSGSSNITTALSFQLQTTHNSSGTIGSWYAAFFTRTSNGGAVTNSYGSYITDVAGSGTVTTNYGLYIAAQTRGATNYALYTNAGLIRLGDSVGVGVVPGAAWVDVAASTSSIAGFRLRSGSSPSSPNNGDIWHISSNLYLRSNSVTYAWGANSSVGALTATASVTTPIITASGNLEVAPIGDLILNPTGDDVLPQNNYDLNLGALNKKYLTLHAAELWVETLVAQDTIATIGGRVLIGPTTTLTADLSTGSTSIQVKHNNLSSGDRVYLEASGKIEFLAITSAASGGGPYTYSVTRNLDGSGANDWFAGDAVFNTGQTGNGFIDLYSLYGIPRNGQSPTNRAGPTIVGNVRISSTYNDFRERWAIGSLNGLYDYSTSIYGFAAGDPTTTWIGVDATNGLRIMRGSTKRLEITTVGNFHIKNSAGNDVIVLDNSGNSYFAGVMEIDTSGEIRQGTGTLGTNFTGLRIWQESDIGRIAGYNAAAVLPQWQAGSNGKLYVGGGNVELDATGITVYYSGVPRLKLDPTDSSFALGPTVPTYSSGDGVWMGIHSGYVKMRIGTAAGERLIWDGTNLNVYGAIQITNASAFSGSGYLQVGSGTKDFNLNGWHFSASEVVGQASGVDQVVLATTGKMSAGGGNVQLHAGGIDLQQDGYITPDGSRAITWWANIASQGGNPTQQISAFYNALNRNVLQLEARGQGGGYTDAQVTLTATTSAGVSKSINLYSDGAVDLPGTVYIAGETTINGAINLASHDLYGVDQIRASAGFFGTHYAYDLAVKGTRIYGAGYDGTRYYAAAIGLNVAWNATTYRVGTDGGSNGGALLLAEGTGETLTIYTIPSTGTSQQSISHSSLSGYERMRVNATGIGIGTTPSYKLDVNGAAHASSFPTSSDERFKEALTPITNVLNRVARLGTYNFYWRQNYSGYDQFLDDKGQPLLQIGFVAQEVEKEFPELISRWKHVGRDGKTTADAYSVDYARMVPVLVQAIRELRSELSALRASLN